MAIKYGTSKNDTISGTSSSDQLYGRAGSDVIYGNAGSDKIYGEAGDDGLYGQDGNDTIHGGTGVDKLSGGLGNDILYGEDGNDWFAGGYGNDKMYGGLGNDTLTYQAKEGGPAFNGLAVLDGGEGRDALVLDFKGNFPLFPTDSGYTMDFVYLGADGNGSISICNDPQESSHVYVGDISGIEEVRVGNGDNTLFISANITSTAKGGAGADIFRGHLGDQTFTGGGGADQFQFRIKMDDVPSSDVITDFKLSEGDLVLFNVVDMGESWPDDRFQTTGSENNGNTIYTTTDTMTGNVMHTVTILGATGLPEPGYWLLG